MSAGAVTLIVYLCAAPAAEARVLACQPPRMVEAPSCEGAIQRVLEQMPAGSVILPAGCEPMRGVRR